MLNTLQTVIDIKRYDTVYETCNALAEYITRFANHGGTIALSGGSTPKLMFSLIAEKYCNIDWSQVKFFWGDERMVPQKNAESNYSEFRRILIETEIIEEKCCFPFLFNNDIQKTIQEAEINLRKFIPFKNNLPQFDLVILGVGEDGHTASFFPDNLASFESQSIVEAVSQPHTGSRRITLTGSTINNAKEIAVLCAGDSKKEILNQIINNNNLTLPAAHLHPKGHISWYLDKAAAGKIQNL